jgi:hypothetical protein
LGNTVYGTFAARGDVNSGGIDDTNMIAPFFFSQAGSAPEPALARVLAERNKPDEVRQWLTLALNAPGAFAFRRDAQQLLDRLAKKP